MGSGLVGNFTVPEASTKLTCPKGHRLFEIKGGVQLIDLGIIFHVEDYLYCPQCRDIFRMSLNNINEGETVIYFIHRCSDKIIEESRIIHTDEADSFLSETLGIARKMLNRIKETNNNGKQ
jgi:hypothetical protein